MNANRIPLVSIVMPAYNSEKYIEDAVQSVQRQTVDSWELIIVDDCSTDSTAAIASNLASEDDRIHLYRNPSNKGAAESRNAGLRLCTGKYVALLDSDDLWLPNKLERQIVRLEKTGADIVYCSYAIIDRFGKPKCKAFIVPEELDFQLALIKSVMSCSTTMFTREIARNYSFPSKYYHEDLALWLTLLKDGKNAVGISEVLASYRVQDDSRASNKVRSAYNRWVVYRKHLRIPFWQSLSLLTRYARLGFEKYKSVAKPAEMKSEAEEAQAQEEARADNA